MHAIKKWTLFLCLSLSPLLSFADDLQEKQHYKVLPADVQQGTVLNTPAQPNIQATEADTKKKKQVIEFFSYGCPGCNAVNPAFDKWAAQQDDKVDVRRVPVVFRASWEPLARAYYTAQYLGVLDKMNPILFEAVHDKKLDLSKRENIRDLFIENGIKPEDFDTTYDSFGVTHQMEQDRQLLQHYQVMAVPSAVINNQFVTDLNMAQTPDEFTRIISVLVDKPQAIQQQQDR